MPRILTSRLKIISFRNGHQIRNSWNILITIRGLWWDVVIKKKKERNTRTPCYKRNIFSLSNAGVSGNILATEAFIWLYFIVRVDSERQCFMSILLSSRRKPLGRRDSIKPLGSRYITKYAFAELIPTASEPINGPNRVRVYIKPGSCA